MLKRPSVAGLPQLKSVLRPQRMMRASRAKFSLRGSKTFALAAVGILLLGTVSRVSAQNAGGSFNLGDLLGKPAVKKPSALDAKITLSRRMPRLATLLQ